MKSIGAEHLSMEFFIDPLFRVTTKLFDEDNAGMALINTLPINSHGCLLLGDFPEIQFAPLAPAREENPKRLA